MIGAGYIGLVSGACFAYFGHGVTCIDKDGDKIAALMRGEIPIFEPAVFIAVGTLSRRGDGHADLSHVHAAVREIAGHLDGHDAAIVTEWRQFRALHMERIMAEMASSAVIDLRNIYRPEKMERLGFTYDSVGRQHRASFVAI